MRGSAAALRGGPELQVRRKMLTIVSYIGSRNSIVHFGRKYSIVDFTSGQDLCPFLNYYLAQRCYSNLYQVRQLEYSTETIVLDFNSFIAGLWGGQRCL